MYVYYVYAWCSSRPGRGLDGFTGTRVTGSCEQHVATRNQTWSSARTARTVAAEPPLQPQPLFSKNIFLWSCEVA